MTDQQMVETLGIVGGPPPAAIRSRKNVLMPLRSNCENSLQQQPMMIRMANYEKFFAILEAGEAMVARDCGLRVQNARCAPHRCGTFEYAIAVLCAWHMHPRLI